MSSRGSESALRTTVICNAFEYLRAAVFCFRAIEGHNLHQAWFSYNV